MVYNKHIFLYFDPRKFFSLNELSNVSQVAQAEQECCISEPANYFYEHKLWKRTAGETQYFLHKLHVYNIVIKFEI